MENHGLSALGAGFSQDLTKGIHQSVPSAYPKHENRDFFTVQIRNNWQFYFTNQIAEIAFPIIREHKSLQLMGEGRIVLDYANSIFRTGEELLATFQNRSGEYRKTLRVGAVATLSKNFQLGFLREVIADNEVEVIIRSAIMRELFSQLQAHLVSEQPVSLLCHKEMRTWETFRFPEDLAGMPVVLPTDNSEIHNGFDQIMDRTGQSLLVAAEADDMAILRLLAREMNAMALATCCRAV